MHPMSRRALATFAGPRSARCREARFATSAGPTPRDDYRAFGGLLASSLATETRASPLTEREHRSQPRSVHSVHRAGATDDDD